MRNLSGSALNLAILLVLKVLRVRMSFPIVPIPDCPADMRIEETEVTAEAMERLTPEMAVLESRQFRKAGFWRHTSASGQIQSTVATYFSADGETLARLFHSINTTVNPPVTEYAAVCLRNARTDRFFAPLRESRVLNRLRGWMSCECGALPLARFWKRINNA